MVGRSFWLLLIAVFMTSTLLLAPLVRAAEQDDGDEYDDGLDEEEQATPDGAGDGKVVTLTSKNFDNVIKDNKNVLVEFYAPWCGHCQSLAPEYTKASLTLAEQAPEVVLAKIDATEESALAEKYGVSGYPTMIWFTDGKESEYDGGRDETTIVRWIMKKVGPAAKTVTTVEELAQAETEGDLTLVGYFGDLTGTSAALTAFTEACRTLDVTCAQTSDAAVAKQAGASKESLSIITKFKPEEKRETIAYKGKMTAEDIMTFANTESLPAVVPFTESFTERIFSVGVSYHMLFIGKPEHLKASNSAFAAYTKVAQKLKKNRDFIYVSVDTADEESEPVRSFFETEELELPVLFGFQMEPGQKKFRLMEKLTEASIEAFGKGILDGSIQPQLKSDEIPEAGEDVDGHVQIVVGKSFDDVVKTSKKDVLLEIYAPWCGHCKSLEPIYKKLATRFKDIDSVVIAKMDGTSNEHADVNTQGFPDITFYPAKEDAEAIKYEGERTLKALTKFIKEHAVIPYELKKKPTAEDTSSGEDSKDDSKDEL